MRVDLSTVGFRQKVEALKSALIFFENMSRDAALFLQEGIVDGVINGQEVGVISGNLRRSIEVAPTSRWSWAIVSDLSIAPYGPQVAKRTRERYGNDFYKIGLERFGPAMEKPMRDEFDRSIKAALNRKQYRYKNPL